MRRLIIIVVAFAILALVLPAHAQQSGRPTRIGILGSAPPLPQMLAGFREGMAERGHVEGKTYIIIPAWRKPGGKPKKTSVLARELVAKGVDVIVTTGSNRARAARRAAPSVPIVLGTSADPVQAGLVQSLARPGGNITGMSAGAADSVLKRMEILKLLVPGLKRVGVIHARPTRPGRTSFMMWSVANKRAAKTLGIEVVRFHPLKKESFDDLLTRIKAAGVSAVTVRSTPLFTDADRRELAQGALKAKLPTASTLTQMAQMGALISLGPDRRWLLRRAAAYVDLILKGAKPADLPVERPAKFKLAVNLKTAKALGIKVPNSLLLRADEVIQ
ncbi:MAG: ABC transporter substrate-binding protein [Alphaproteobacteria bacterium]|nr:ABC transporter substrate-binding protein [Alphaproteobacteria bacterium]